MPFEFARVSLPTRERPAEFLVFAPQHAYAEPGASPGGDRTVAAFSLDETAKYFLILVALCEPRLRDGASVALPTAGEIVERLRGRLELTRAAVNHHIDYLAIEKLRVKAPEPGRLDSKREALVAIALRYGIVRDEHRRLLPRRGSMTRAVVDVPPGFRAGAWRVGEHIASGSWGSVYAARGEDGTEAALKFIAGGLLSPSQYAQLEEARFNEQADHPGLVRTFETFVVDDESAPAVHGAVVVAMERGERNLQDALGDVDPVPVITAVCEALVHIHARGWVHGDLKPCNVLLMADGSVRLADFGLARELEGTHAYAPRVGSSDFLPPEWWSERISERGIPVRPTVDIWALGVTIHQLLTGGLYPFPGPARAPAAPRRRRTPTGARRCGWPTSCRRSGARSSPTASRPTTRRGCRTRRRRSSRRIPGRARARRRRRPRWPAAARGGGGRRRGARLDRERPRRGPRGAGDRLQRRGGLPELAERRLPPRPRGRSVRQVRARERRRPRPSRRPAGRRLLRERRDGRSPPRTGAAATAGIACARASGEAWLPAVRLAPTARPAVARCGR